MVRERSEASFYERLRRAAFSASGSPVLIFPSAADTDSLCAFKIATALLASDSVRFSAYPVCGSSDPKQLAGLSVNPDDQPLVVLLINWGGSLDLFRLLNLGPKVLVFVVDSHRPIHLRNLSDYTSQVIVLYTLEDETQANVRYSFEIGELANSPDYASEDDDEASEDESDDDDVGSAAGRRLGADDIHSRERREIFKRKREYYGMGTFHGKPSGCLMYDLAHALHKNSNELLWLACVSLTDQYVHVRTTSERYQSGVMELEQRVNSAGNLDVNTSITLKDGTKVRAPDVSRIMYEEEPRLMLLREWNLYDSMLCSSYVATKLKTWSDVGLRRLRLLLARMGFPLVECQQKYQHMSGDTKKRLKEEFIKFSNESGLDELYYRSFLRLHGYNSKVSAADVVYGVTALLEAMEEKDGKVDADNWAGQFWTAYKALSINSWDVLQSGMQLAIKVQKATLQQGSLAIARNGVRSCQAFRWLTLDMNADVDLLSHPLSLTKLCYFLLDALREQGRRARPMICAAPVPGKSNFYLVVGVPNRPVIGQPNGNGFGRAFRAVAERLGVEFCQDAFESSWIRLDMKAVNTFFLRVQEMLTR